MVGCFGAADFESGSGAGLGATDDDAVEADGGRETRFVGDRARAGAGSEKSQGTRSDELNNFKNCIASHWLRQKARKSLVTGSRCLGILPVNDETFSWDNTCDTKTRKSMATSSIKLDGTYFCASSIKQTTDLVIFILLDLGKCYFLHLGLN